MTLVDPRLDRPASLLCTAEIINPLTDATSTERMGKPTGFTEFSRHAPQERDPALRMLDWSEFHEHLSVGELREQGARCMDCGVPFCHTGDLMANMAAGCPVNNLIPEWNDLVYRDRWREALDRLHATNNFPEFTGRVCPAPCEGSCVLGIIEPPVTIKSIECAIIDRGFEEGWVTAKPPRSRTGKTVAVVGSGPAGLAAAAQLNGAGHRVTVFERADRIGGLLMYGIPNMKLEKSIVERRVKLLSDEGIEFLTGKEVGHDPTGAELLEQFDAVVLCTGATRPARPADSGPRAQGNSLRDGVPARQHQEPARLRPWRRPLHQRQGQARDRDRRRRHGDGLHRHVDAAWLPQPGELRDCADAARGAGRQQSVAAVAAQSFASITGTRRRLLNSAATRASLRSRPSSFNRMATGNVRALKAVRVDWSKPIPGKAPFSVVEGSEEIFECDLVLLALGFLGPETAVSEQLGIEVDERANYKARLRKVPHERRQTSSRPETAAAARA